MSVPGKWCWQTPYNQLHKRRFRDYMTVFLYQFCIHVRYDTNTHRMLSIIPTQYAHPHTSAA
jgi:hypothetical protein